MARELLTRDDLAPVAHSALGGGRRLETVERIAGGSRKGVYRLTMDDGFTAIAYRWDAAENYWPAGPRDGDLADPFSAGVGPDLFRVAHTRLASLGLRVPEIYRFDGDLAVLEDFPGGNLMDRLARDPAAAAPTMARLREALAAMRAATGPAPGKIAHVDRGGTSHWPTVEAAVLALGQRCLAEAAGRDHRIADARDRLADRLLELAAAVQPRDRLSVVHGELGLDHVLVDRDGHPVLIDIEDLMYFDVEWEHVFLRIRLNDDYPLVAVDGLDPDRLALYMLAERLSLVAGPLRLLDGDFPNRPFMRRIAEHNLKEALALI